MGPHSQDLSELTPEILRLAQDGLWLTQYYGQQVCTASRAALVSFVVCSIRPRSSLSEPQRTHTISYRVQKDDW